MGTVLQAVSKKKVDLNNLVGPPLQAKKKIDVPKKTFVVKKDTTAKSKENIDLNKKNITAVKPKAEIIVQKKAAVQVQNKVSEVVKSSQIQQTKEMGIYDPDEKTKDDPLMVVEYTEDILAYLRTIEDKYPIKEKFLEGAKVTSKMRATLVNWLVEAHMNFSLELDTLYLCISIIDRYLQVNKSVDRSVFQLVGASALLLSCKHEELYVPDVSDFVFICDNAFKKEQILQMEVDIVKKLDFRMGWPLGIYFLRRYSKVAQVKSDHYNLAKYILELGLLEYNVSSIKPSLQAAAACCLSMAVLNMVSDPSKVWTPTLAHYTKYHYSDFKQYMYDYADLIAKAETSKHDTIKQKYSSSKFGKISLSFKLNGPLIRKMTLSPVLK
ncbi:hypothetical protein GWI33_006823 [Rhynchophorus ferrugineus]|uniref:Uncharacterized protein n=1 Tax=Rhynchophorus ferrugineus TaxID=354439 RepID=A0A834MDD8_RHYFE|nr:hypothetical protein GWI33_006823 [Rhynchophorus ferrugineus]